MNPVILVAIDTIANSFDQSDIKVAPVVTIEFQTETDLNKYLDQLHREILHYAKNQVILRPTANEIHQLNDVFCVFKLRSN